VHTDLDTLATAPYVTIDDTLKTSPELRRWRPAVGITPKLETILPSGSWPVGQGGPGLAFAAGSVWVANADQRRVARVEPGADPTPISVGASPVAIAAAPDADIVWVAGRTRSGSGLLVRIDARTNQVARRTFSVPYAPSGLAVTADGGTVWTVTTKDRTRARSTPAPAIRESRSSSG
jgi:hypothetical protein